MQKALEYKEWRKFNGVIEKAKIACAKSNVDTNGQFVQSDKLSINVNGGERKIKDYHLSRYADEDESRFPIQNWLRKVTTINFLGLWNNLIMEYLIWSNSTKLKLNMEKTHLLFHHPNG